MRRDARPNAANHNPYCTLYQQASYEAFAAERPPVNGVSNFPFTIEEMENPEPTQALIDLMKLPSIKVVYNK